MGTTKRRPLKTELAQRLADAERELQAVQRAIRDGVIDRERYLVARMNLREVHAQVWAVLNPGRDPV